MAIEVSEQAEELLEACWLRREGGESEPGPDAPEGDAVVVELVEAGLVELGGPGARLTGAGWREAGACVRRHRLAERLMADVLHVRKALMHEVSCKFEHLLHRGLEGNVCTLLGHPKMCPHGQLIPEGTCCRRAGKQTSRLVFASTELKAGQEARIAYIHTGNREALQKLMAMGTLPGVSITLIQRSPSYVFQIGQSQFAVDREMAEHIFVRPRTEGDTALPHGRGKG